MPSDARSPTIEARLRALDGEQRRAEAIVYADWLQARGDARGAVAAAALAVDEADEDAQSQRRHALEQLVREHSRELFGPLYDRPTIAVRYLGPVLDSLLLRDHQADVDCTALADLLARPICACLRELSLVGEIASDQDLSGCLASAACASGLRTLRLVADRGGPRLYGEAFARLETLALAGSGFILGPGRFRALQTLELTTPTGVPSAQQVVAVNAPMLAHLSLGIAGFALRRDAIRTRVAGLLSRPAFAGLRTLTLRSGPASDWLLELRSVLAEIPASETLELVDLRGVPMSSEQRRWWEDAPYRLPYRVLLPDA